MNRKELLGERLASIKKEIGPTQLLAVSKRSPVEDILFAYENGHRDFGENRVDVLTQKSHWFKENGIDDICWHFIGHLQSNKVNQLLKVPNLFGIHSIDSLKLLKAIYEKLKSHEREDLYYFLQVNTSGEKEKSGFHDYVELHNALKTFYSWDTSPLVFKGLMTMGKIRTDDISREARKSFQKLKMFKNQLMDDFNLKSMDLSMGMSGDYHIAASEGSSWVRIGQNIFKDGDLSLL